MTLWIVQHLCLARLSRVDTIGSASHLLRNTASYSCGTSDSRPGLQLTKETWWHISKVFWAFYEKTLNQHHRYRAYGREASRLRNVTKINQNKSKQGKENPPKQVGKMNSGHHPIKAQVVPCKKKEKKKKKNLFWCLARLPKSRPNGGIRGSPPASFQSCVSCAGPRVV